MKKHSINLNFQYILFAVLSFAFAYSVATAQSLQTNLPVTNDDVKAVLFDSESNVIYLGGSFTYVGPNTGYGVALDNSTGNTVSGFPYVNGTIYAVASDGSGGWYIGGEKVFDVCLNHDGSNAAASFTSDISVIGWRDGNSTPSQHKFKINKWKNSEQTNRNFY